MTRSKIAVLLASLALATPAMASDLAAERQQALDLIKQFGGALKSELQSAMKQGGPTAAISVCNQQAPLIAERLSGQSPWQVGRTSLRIRNPANRPDAWERGVLDSFERRRAAGEAPAEIDHLELVEVDDHREVRYMKAIATEEICTRCHGARIDEAVKARLDELYPQDEARGYAPGEIRGAFTLRRRVDIGY